MNLIRTIRRIDRATGRIRDTAIKAAVRWIKAYRKRNGQRVKAHKRMLGGARGSRAVKTKKRTNYNEYFYSE